MPSKFKSLPDAATYLNVPESEIVALAAGGALPVHFRHYGRAGLFALVGSDCLTTVPSSDFIEAGIYRSMFNPMVLREAPMEVYLPTTAILPVDPPRSVPVGQIMARVDEISRELDNSDIESGRWLFLVADLDAVAKTLAPTTPEYQAVAVPTADQIHQGEAAPAVVSTSAVANRDPVQGDPTIPPLGHHAEKMPPLTIGSRVQTEPPASVTKAEILAVFTDPIRGQTKEQWKRMLGDVPGWLKEARIDAGGKSIQSRWNPAKLAMCLAGKGYMGRGALGSLIRRDFPEYLPEWEAYAGSFERR